MISNYGVTYYFCVDIGYFFQILRRVAVLNTLLSPKNDIVAAGERAMLIARLEG